MEREKRNVLQNSQAHFCCKTKRKYKFSHKIWPFSKATCLPCAIKATKPVKKELINFKRNSLCKQYEPAVEVAFKRRHDF